MSPASHGQTGATAANPKVEVPQSPEGKGVADVDVLGQVSGRKGSSAPRAGQLRPQRRLGGRWGAWAGPGDRLQNLGPRVLAPESTPLAPAFVTLDPILLPLDSVPLPHHWDPHIHSEPCVLGPASPLGPMYLPVASCPPPLNPFS